MVGCLWHYHIPYKVWSMPWLNIEKKYIHIYIYFCAWGSESNFQGEFLKLFWALCSPLRWRIRSKHITEFPNESSQPKYLLCPLPMYLALLGSSGHIKVHKAWDSALIKSIAKLILLEEETWQSLYRVIKIFPHSQAHSLTWHCRLSIAVKCLEAKQSRIQVFPLPSVWHRAHSLTSPRLSSMVMMIISV
jgi:hypothetical protein